MFIKQYKYYVCLLDHETGFVADRSGLIIHAVKTKLPVNHMHKQTTPETVALTTQHCRSIIMSFILANNGQDSIAIQSHLINSQCSSVGRHVIDLD